ncbi:MAG: FkbM family methyltransferase [Acidobacteriota bacterium]|nr:FkbM family methyltransferase [Acidobacteriota bacterium]
MIGRLKTGARHVIGQHRRSSAVGVLHKVASFIESAYANEGSEFSENGEQGVIDRLRPADLRTALDVGANFGDWTLEALAAWRNCRVHAFEVAPPTFKVLEAKIAASPFRDRASLNGFGLSDTNSTLPMFYFPDHPELTCDLPRHEYPATPFNAELRTGAEYAESAGLATIDFLKIDVEGAEHRVLKGFKSWLADGRIHCIQFEYGAFATQTKFLLADFYALLGERYWIGKIYRNYVDFREYDWNIESFRFSNYCCVSKSRPDLRDLLQNS